MQRKFWALTALGYPAAELARVSTATIQRTFACGNPLRALRIGPGETVVDLGSGAGLDCILLSNRFGHCNRVVGLDITPAMVSLARRSADAAGSRHVQFGVGDVEALPLETSTANVVLSNGVICLAEDKERVFREAYRVLQDGGRLIVADLFHTGPLLVRHLSARLCGARRASSPAEYESSLKAAGFENVVIHSRRVFRIEEAATLWGVRPVIRWLARLGSRRPFRSAANRLLQWIPSIHLTATKPYPQAKGPAI